jgi:hypothetical protein
MRYRPSHAIAGLIAATSAITACGTDAGGVFVFYGRAERLSGTVELSTADAVIRTVAPGTAVGRIARAGDVDGDGHGDFLLGSQGLPMRDIYLIRGATARLAGTVALADIAPSPLVAVEPCVDSFAAALDDLDGDGFDDFSLKSCPDIRNLFLTVRIHNLFHGRSNGFPAQARPDATLATSTIGPSQIASGDVDGDGVRELVIGETGLHEGNGGVHVIATEGLGCPARWSWAPPPRPTSVDPCGRPTAATPCATAHFTSRRARRWPWAT